MTLVLLEVVLYLEPLMLALRESGDEQNSNLNGI